MLCHRDRRTTKPVARRPLRPTGYDGMGPAATRRSTKGIFVSMCCHGALHLARISHEWRS